MFTESNFLRFIMAAAIAGACGVLLINLSTSPSCPCRGAALPEHDHHLALLPGDDDDGLPELLRSAAMEDKTVIMTFMNEAWTAPGSLLDLFLESFREGDGTAPLVEHLVIVSVDGKALEKCKRVHRFCYSIDVGGGVNLTTEQLFMAKDYLEMMWARNRFQTRILELGYAFLFTDMDILWFRNPFLRIPVGADITISSDKFHGENPYDLRKDANGGFLYARPSARTVAFFKDWYAAREQHPGQNEQYMFDQLKHELSRRHGAVVQLADTAYFGGFCQPKMDFRQLCTFHGNCLKGLKTKLHRLRRVLDQWKQFKKARNNAAATTTQ